MNVKDVRKTWRLPRKRQECLVCGKYEAITEAHHILPVRYIAHVLKDVSVYSMYEYAIRTKNEIKIPHVWLCPNHHTMWHLIIIYNGELRNDFANVLIEKGFDDDDIALIARAFHRLQVGEYLVNFAVSVVNMQEWLNEKESKNKHVTN